MAATEQVLSTLARLGNLGLGGVETPENRPSEQDSSLFSALLEESGGGNRSPDEKPAARKTEDDGNGLPALPVAMPIAAPAATPVADQAPAQDTELEDFAVKLGIDRSLARLLLTQTSGAPEADATMAPVATPDVAGFTAAFQTAALQNALPAANDVSVGLSSAGFTASLLAAGAQSVDSGLSVPEPSANAPVSINGLSSAGFTASLLAAGVANQTSAASAASDLGADELPQPTAAAGENADAAASNVAASNVAASNVDFAATPRLSELDLARLTAAPVSITVTSAAPNPSTVAPRGATIVPPALSAAPEALTSIAAAPLGDEDLLRWRSIAARAESPTAATKLDPAASEQSEDVAAEVSTTLVDGVKDRFATKEVGNRATRTKDGVRSRDAQVNTDELLGISSLRSMALEHATAKAPTLAMNTLGGIGTQGMALQSASPSVMHGDASAATPGFAIDPGATTVTQGNSSGASGGIMNEPLRMPEPKLDFATRAEMFADQVAQRVLGQIRNQAYDVSLQLDPRNLGPMDISLRVDGAQVTANVAVTHPEVRGLLESGLPRLRESLESAGLSLTNWSFAQSSSRDPSSARQGGGSAAGEMRRVSRVADDAETGVAVNAIAGGSNRAVDLFV